MSNQNYFTISQDSWSLLSVATNGAATSLQGFSSSSSWNTNLTLTDLQALIDATPNGGTLDLDGKRYMAPDIGDPAYSSEPGNTYLRDTEDPDNLGVYKAITIKNGIISGTRPMTWTAHPTVEGAMEGVVVSVDSDEAFDRITLPQQDTSGAPTPGDKLLYLVDYRNDVQYANCVWPKSTQTLRKSYTTTYNPLTWFIGQADGEGVVPGTSNYQCDVYSKDVADDTETINVSVNTWNISNIFKLKFRMGDEVDGVWTENNATGTVKAPAWQAMEAELDSKDLTTARVYIRSGPNASLDADLISWDSATGELEFEEVIYYSGYVQFCLAGHIDWLDPGQYFIDELNRKIVLKPFSHTSSIAPASQGIELAALPILFYGTDKCDVTFENVTFVGSGGNSGSQAMVRKDGQPYERIEDLPDNPGTYLLPDRVTVDGNYQPSNDYRIQLNNCRLLNGAQATRGDIDISDSYFNNFREYTCTSTDGATMINNYFGICERWENLTVFCQNYGNDPEDPTTTVSKTDQLQARKTIIRDNIFFNPITTHGQGLSLYNTAWMNAEVTHNIFVDFVRAASFQGRDDGSRRTVPSKFAFANNLILFDNPLEYPPGGQMGVSYNGTYGDNYIDPSGSASQFGSDQILHVYNNTLLFNPLAKYVKRDDVKQSGLDFWRIYTSQMTIANNIASYLKPSDNETDFVETKVGSEVRRCFDMPGRYANNLSYSWDNDISSWSATDLPNPPRDWSDTDMSVNSPATMYDYERLRAYDEYQTVANDGGVIGHRWGGNITAAKVRDMVSGNWDPYWALKYPAEAVPEPASWVGGADSASHEAGPAADNSTPVWRYEDNRP